MRPQHRPQLRLQPRLGRRTRLPRPLPVGDRDRICGRCRTATDTDTGTEPGGGGVRPTGMLTVKVHLRRAASAVVLAASLTMGAAACGSATSDGGPRMDPVDSAPSGTAEPVTPSSAPTVPPTDGSTTPARTPGAGSGAGSIASRVVYFSSSVRAVAGTHEVLHDRGELDRFAATVAKNDARTAAEISAGAAATDFARYVMVGWTESTGCSAATSATLSAAGNSLKLHVEQPKPMPECLTDFRVTVVFEVPKARMPARPAFH